jgi:hypothetical protein
MEPDETNVTLCGGLFYHRKADGGGIDRLSLSDVRRNLSIYKGRCDRHDSDMKELLNSGGNEEKIAKLQKTVENNYSILKYWQDAEQLMVERQKQTS